MAFGGINVLKSGDRIVTTFDFYDDVGSLVTAGTGTYRIFELQSDGTLKSYDFNDNTFKTTALTTATASLTQRTGNNSTYNTGVWSASLTTLTGFTSGNIYLFVGENTNATPGAIKKWAQFGGIDADSTAVPNALFATVTEGSTTFVQAVRGMSSALLGKASGLGTTTPIYRDLADSKDRITATVDTDGNRSAVTRDLA